MNLMIDLSLLALMEKEVNVGLKQMNLMIDLLLLALVDEG